MDRRIVHILQDIDRNRSGERNEKEQSQQSQQFETFGRQDLDKLIDTPGIAQEFEETEEHEDPQDPKGSVGGEDRQQVDDGGGSHHIGELFPQAARQGRPDSKLTSYRRGFLILPDQISCQIAGDPEPQKILYKKNKRDKVDIVIVQPDRNRMLDLENQNEDRTEDQKDDEKVEEPFIGILVVLQKIGHPLPQTAVA